MIADFDELVCNGFNLDPATISVHARRNTLPTVNFFARSSSWALRVLEDYIGSQKEADFLFPLC